jgi:uncharacterized delta-60 repeat protein
MKGEKKFVSPNQNYYFCTMKQLFIYSTLLLLLPFLASAQDGTLDATFGTGGTATLVFGGFASDARTIAIQPDGKILIAGTAAGGGSSVAIARYSAAGVLDATFGTAGKIKYNLNNSPNITSMALYADGDILLGGKGDAQGFLFRLNADGTKETTFGIDGVVTFANDFTGIVDLRILAGNKILGCGNGKNGSNTYFSLFQRNADGTPDTGFGTAGYINHDLGSQETLVQMALQSDGKILLTGTVFENATAYDLIVCRFKTDGTFDTSFGTNGITTSSFTAGAYEQGYDIETQSDGKIVVAGRSSLNGLNSFLMVRYKTNGTLDNTFGTNGRTITSVSGSMDEAHSLAITADGKMLAAGFSGDATNRLFTVIRYKSNGTADATFGTNGVASTSIGAKSSAEEVLVQPNGKIVVGGYSDVNPRAFALARYNNTVGTIGTSAPALADFQTKVYPNPITGNSCTVEYILPVGQSVSHQLYSTEGRLIETLLDKKQNSGVQTEVLNLPIGLNAGIYILKIHTEIGIQSIPLQIIR